ncbi:Hypothetical protein EIN_272160, partial [Entamoeba invadens IP1]
MKAFGYIFHNVNLTSKDNDLYGTKIDFSAIKTIYNEDKNITIKNTPNTKNYNFGFSSDITKFVIPSQIEVLNNCDYIKEYIKEVDISLVIERVTKKCFSNVKLLQSVTFSDSLKIIKDEVFYN